MSIGRALVCSYAPPQPDRDSGSRRLLDLMDLLAEEGWAVTFLAANGIPSPPHARLLERRGFPVFDATSMPVERLLADGQFDLTVIAFWQIAEFYLPLVRRVSPGTRVVVDSVDLQFIREARRILGSQSYGALLDEGYGAELIAELNVYAAADAVLTVSAAEAEIAGGLLGTRQLIRSVPDIEEPSGPVLPFERRRGIVFVGSFRHPPNVDAIEYLCEDIAPLLDEALLDEHPISIVGDGMEQLVRLSARGLSNLNVVGWVPSVTPYLEQARISIVPLRYGAGTKRKMLQALTLGTATVTSPIGAEGLELRSGEHVLVADDPKDFANAMSDLLRDRALWQRLSDKGRRHIARAHGRDAVRARLVAALRDASARPPKASRLPEVDEDHYHARVSYLHKQKLLPRIRQVVRECVPEEAVVAVVSEGDEDLLQLGPATGWHYPQTSQGGPLIEHPADSAAAIALLEDVRRRGASYLLVPVTSGWWFGHYPEWAAHLHAHHGLVSRHEDLLTLFTLGEADGDVRPERVDAAARAADRQGPAEEVQLVVEPAPSSSIRADPARRQGETSAGSGAARLVAFYLPQFHPIPENDEWWGEGFTEWMNVSAAMPLFRGHAQPHLPADLGFYDLRLAETRAAQAALARAYGISAFCYYHYWFQGKRLLERPFDEVLASGQPDLQFCLCWANEPWSRRWDGQPHDVLQPQSYSADDDVRHIRWLLPALRDPRALTVDGKPVFIVYQARDLPDPGRTVAVWRDEVEKAGLSGLYLMTVETGWDAGWDATEVGFDAKVLFQPQFSTLFQLPRMPGTEGANLRVYDYQEAWPVLADPDPVGYRRYDTVFPGWDNSPRRGPDAVVLDNSTPEAYGRWLRRAIDKAQSLPGDERLVFINAWNEWGEGCHLEPDQRHGSAFLEETARALVHATGAAEPARGR